MRLGHAGENQRRAQCRFRRRGPATLATGREAAVRHRIREEEKERFRPEDFAHLDVGEIITYNKGRPGRAAKVGKGRAGYLSCTRRPDGTRAVSERVREYYRELLENITFERGQSAGWNCRPDSTSLQFST